jgi:hypothetical protein
MGANAQIAVPAFTAGQVLTAAQQTQINTGIPVFATTTTRDAAFGGTGEKVLAEGQFAYIEATNTTQYYDGSAWQSVGVAPGMVLITTATASAVQTLSINDCFSSTYAAYQIEMIITASVGANSALTARLRVGGADTTTAYGQQMLYAVSTTVAGVSDPTGGASWFLGETDPTYNNSFQSMTIHNPNVATRTRAQADTNNVTSSGLMYVYKHALSQGSTTQFTGISIITAGTSFTGTVRVYGLANS